MVRSLKTVKDDSKYSLYPETGDPSAWSQCTSYLTLSSWFLLFTLIKVLSSTFRSAPFYLGMGLSPSSILCAFLANDQLNTKSLRAICYFPLVSLVLKPPSLPLHKLSCPPLNSQYYLLGFLIAGIFLKS